MSEFDGEIYENIKKIVNNVEEVIIGKSDTIYLSLVALFSKGNLLIEDVPGVGKTMLVKALTKSIDGTFKRIQFTPDLLPSDITGVSIYNKKTEEFEFRPGPIVANIVLADEINRTSPKTQSALLEAMEEKVITVDGISYPLPFPFFVMATQNPIEYEGTFPLPEAQLDRFMLKINMGYPDKEDEIRLLHRINKEHPIEKIKKVIRLENLVTIQNTVQQVYIDESLIKYIVNIIEATRLDDNIYLGASPRGSISLMRGAQALALIKGRDFVVPDDIKYLVPSVLSHRIILKSEYRLHGLTKENVLKDILKKVSVPISIDNNRKRRNNV